MPRQLRYTDDAIRDLEGVRRWQFQPGSGPAAIRRVKAIQAAIRNLKRMPCLYAAVDHPGVRELPCEGHRVMYVVEPDTERNDSSGDVLVLRVFGPGQSRERL